jgi:hypothetical protein
MRLLAAVRRPVAPALVALTASAGLTACGGGDGPTESGPLEVYALATVDGQPLPYPPPSVAGARLVADTLYLLRDDRLRRVYVQTEAPLNPAVVNAVRTELTGEWRRVPSGYVIATREGGLTFAVRGSALVRVAARPAGAGTMELVYERAGP